MQGDLANEIDQLLSLITGRSSGYGEEPTYTLLEWDAKRGSYNVTYKFCCQCRAVLKEALHRQCVERSLAASTTTTPPSMATSDTKLTIILDYFITMILDVDKLQVETNETTDWKGLITNECMKVFLDILSAHSHESSEHNLLSGTAMLSEPPPMFGTTLGPGTGTN